MEGKFGDFLIYPCTSYEAYEKAILKLGDQKEEILKLGEQKMVLKKRNK